MILKTKDSQDAQLRLLEQQLQRSTSEKARRSLERERTLIQAGLEGEKEAAYHIDFHLKDQANWAVIHDLRLDWNGRIAQIDHLLIDRLLEVFVVESKNFKTKVRHANGGWERLYYGDWQGVPSPVEQNCRHIDVLKELITQQGWAPTRLGLPIPLRFFNVVLVNPSCSVVGTFPKDVRIFQMDSFVRTIRSEDLTMVATLKIVSVKTLHELAQRIVASHKPASQMQTGSAATTSDAAPRAGRSTKGNSARCSGCGGYVSRAEKYFCEINQARFAGAVLCRKCQALAPQDIGGAPQCSNCGCPVERKVVEFCQENSTRFAGKVLCRKCQRR